MPTKKKAKKQTEKPETHVPTASPVGCADDELPPTMSVQDRYLEILRTLLDTPEDPGQRTSVVAAILTLAEVIGDRIDNVCLHLGKLDESTRDMRTPLP